MDKVNTETSDQLYSLIATEDDRNEVLSLLQNFSASIFKTKEKTPKGELLGNTRFGPAINTCLPANWESFEVSEIQKILSDLIEKVKNLENIKITLAINPTDKIIKAMRSYFENKFILDIEVDPRILGGIIYISNGQYHDASLLKRLNDHFNMKREEITKSISGDQQ